MPTILEHFDALTERGLQVIPLWQNSKIPLCKSWTKEWDLGKNREKLQQHPEANIGVLLGEVIDVEGDSKHANDVILDIIEDYPHPCYQSSRSIHHLFQSPHRDLRIFKCGKIEFRGYGHQSVLPPSQHQGFHYRWISSSPFPVPPMPPKLWNFLQKRWGIKSQKKCKTNHKKVWCDVCDKKQYVHKKRLGLEIQVFQSLGQKWECQKCRTIDLRPLVRQMKAFT